MGKSPDQVQKTFSNDSNTQSSNQTNNATATSTNNLWQPLNPLLNSYMGQLGGLMNGKPEVYGGQRVAGLSGQTMGGVNALYGAGNPTALTSASLPMLAATANGDFLNGNPYFNKQVDEQSAKMADTINGIFSGMGRYGSAAHQGKLASDIGSMRNAAMADNYGRERGLQMQAAGMSPMFEGLQEADALNKLKAGGVIDGHQQQVLDAQRQKFLEGTKGGQLQQALGLMNPLLGLGGSVTNSSSNNATSNVTGTSTSDGKTVVPGQKPGFGQIAGLGLGLLGTLMTGGAAAPALLGGMGGLGGMGAMGGLLGGLGGMMGNRG